MTKNVLVFGGTSGIGAACVDLLTAMGLFTYAVGAEECDVRDPVAVATAIQEASPDAVIYAAGINRLEWTHSIEASDFEEVMAVNVWGFLNVIQRLEERSGAYSVVAVTSDAARRPMRTSAVYCASKAALDQVIRVSSRELCREGWRINGVAPGKVSDTGMTRYVDERVLVLRGWTREFAERYERESSPIARPLAATEVAEVVCAVLLAEAPGWTGDIVTINGGR